MSVTGTVSATARGRGSPAACSCWQTLMASFAPLADQLEAAVSAYAAADLALVGEVVNRLRTTMAAYIDAVGSTPQDDWSTA